jgi:hypothetical protein
MNIQELLACMDRLGARLVREGEALHVDAPRGVLTQELRDDLAAHKAELLALPEIVQSLVPWPPRPAELATWPEFWREQWGRLANELEGLRVARDENDRDAWRMAEREAFIRVRQEIADQDAAWAESFKDTADSRMTQSEALA